MKKRRKDMLPRMSSWMHNVRPSGARWLGASERASGEKDTDAETLDEEQ
jgi:hypothetical protein